MQWFLRTHLVLEYSRTGAPGEQSAHWVSNKQSETLRKKKIKSSLLHNDSFNFLFITLNHRYETCKNLSVTFFLLHIIFINSDHVFVRN